MKPSGEQPSGQAFAFRRDADPQVEPSAPSVALVPTNPVDATAPIDVDAIRALLAPGVPASGIPGIPAAPSGPLVFDGMPAPMTPLPPPPAASTSIAGIPAAAVPVPTGPTGLPTPTGRNLPAGFNVPTVQLSPSGPPVVMPSSVTVPALRNPATTVPAARSKGRVDVHAASAGADEPPLPPAPSPRHSGGSGKKSKLPTAVWISALLAACAGAALVLINAGNSMDPLAPTALPTRPASPSPTPHPSPSAKPLPTPSPSPTPSLSASPSHSASASASTSASATASPSPSVVASFSTIYWTTSADPRVADIQRRLVQLNYLTVTSDGKYADTSRTLNLYQTDWKPQPDAAGMYHNTTDMAIRAFKYDYMQHGHGQPSPGCDTQTYQALVNATS